MRFPRRWRCQAPVAAVLALLLVACGTSRRDEPASGLPHTAGPGAASETARADAHDDRKAGVPATRGGDPEPRRDLSIDERRGGHTIARHVARTDDELRDRLRRERITAASTYDDLATAEHVVAATLRQAGEALGRWTRRRGNRPNLALRYRGRPEAPIGRSLSSGGRHPVPCYDAVVVLRWDARADDFYVLTSYPEVRR